MSRRSGTDGSLLGSLPWSLLALVVALAPHAPYLPSWVMATFIACGGARYYIERRRWRLPPPWLRIVLAMVAFLAILFSYDKVSGVGPGSALLAIMAALKLLETRQRRDQFVLLFIAIFLIMASLLREQYLWSLPYLALSVVVTMTAWLRMSMSRPVPITRNVATGARLLLYAMPVALIMWVFFPRIATPFWAVPIDTSSGSSGLSDTMSPGDISNLSLSNAVAFRVHFDDPIPPPSERYWRGLVLHQFNGRTWSGQEPNFDPAARDRISVSGAPIRYQVTLEPTRQQWLFALEMPADWDLPRSFMGRQLQLASVQPIDQRIAYEAVSYTSYRAEPDRLTVSRSWYTRLPDGANPRTLEYARQVRAAVASDEQFIDAVLRTFREEEFFYTLRPPALGSDPVDRFLFETRRGFCEHYASAFAVMMRAVGLPARIVVGYQGGELNPFGNYMIVRQADAHAWTEVWLPGRGWHRLDPTAAVAPQRIEAGISGSMFDAIGASWGLSAPAAWLHRLTLTWDAMNAKWNEWILGYGPENQYRFMEWLGMEEPGWRNMMFTLLALVALAVAAISVLLALRYRPPRRDPAALLYHRYLRRVARRTGVQARTGETPVQFAKRVVASEPDIAHAADRVTDCYLEARYGRAGDGALDGLRAAVAEFRVLYYRTKSGPVKGLGRAPEMIVNRP